MLAVIEMYFVRLSIEHCVIHQYSTLAIARQRPNLRVTILSACTDFGDLLRFPWEQENLLLPTGATRETPSPYFN
jgi:hypothetical protein